MLQLEDNKEKRSYIFPVQRWIWVEKHYYLYEFDAFLPHEDRQIETRKIELERKRMEFVFKETIENGPKQVTDSHSSDIFALAIIFYIDR